MTLSRTKEIFQLIILLTFLLTLLVSIVTGLKRQVRSPKPQSTGDNGGLFPEGDNGDSDSPEKFNSENSKTGRKIRKGELYLPEDYNKHEIPDEAEALGLNSSPLLVRVHIRIREIGDLNELDEKITITMDVRLWWTDWQISRANQESINPSGDGFVISLDEDTPETKSKKLDPSFLKNIWKPDLFIESLLSASRPEFIAKPVKVVYRSDGTLILQSRVTVTLGCNMDFHYYPADSQECPFLIRSYSFESSEMELEWGYPKPSVYAYDRRNTNFEIQITEPVVELLSEESLELEVKLSDFTFSFGSGPAEEVTLEPKHKQEDRKNETFYVLKFTIKARRMMSYHLIQTYLPSIFFIAITYLCFFIPPTMVECRIGITMTTLLTLTAMFASVRESSPIVSYCKAIDLWMIACIFFVFAVLFEFALLIWFGLTKELEIDSCNMKISEDFEMREVLRDGDVVTIKDPGINSNGVVTARRIEQFAVPSYLILFLIFNVLYWSWLMRSSKYFDWEVDKNYNIPDEF